MRTEKHGTTQVTQDHRVAGWARAMRAERICLKQAAERGGSAVDKDTRSVILELEKRLATAERAKEEAQRVADVPWTSLDPFKKFRPEGLPKAEARSERAHTFQDKYVNALENQESFCAGCWNNSMKLVGMFWKRNLDVFLVTQPGRSDVQRL